LFRCSPPVVGFAFGRHTAFGPPPCNEEAMDTVPIVRPPSSAGDTQNTVSASSQLQPVTVAMDESDGNGVILSSGGDSNARQSKSSQFLLPQPGVSFHPTPYTIAPCQVISQQPFSEAVPIGGTVTGGIPVPSIPVSVPCYTIRQVPPSQPVVQPQVYYRPADGFCVTSSARSILEEPQDHS